jgi:hypothetical protein
MFEIELLTTIFSEISPEVLFAIGGFGFNLLVIPTLLDSNAGIPRTQSVMSAVVLLFFFAIPYYWIGFHWSAFANLIGVVLWSVVAIYRAPTTTATSPKDSPATTAQPAD